MNFINLFSLISIFILTLVITLSYAEGSERIPDFYIGGIQVNEPDNEKWVKTLKSAGMNTVSVTVYARQGNWDSDNLEYPTRDKSVVDEIRTAKANGLNVILIMRVALDHHYPENPFLWHGMIIPQSDNDLASWFKKYTAFVSNWAGIAEKEGVEVFVIGSEMNSLTSTKPVSEIPEHMEYFSNELKQIEVNNKILRYDNRISSGDLFNAGKKEYLVLQKYLEDRSSANKKWADQVSYINSANRIQKINERKKLLNANWVSLIETVKSVYSRKISYAANFDNYQDVSFWQNLDYISINAYFPLKNSFKNNSSKKQLMTEAENSWKNIFTEIKDFQKKNNLGNKKIIFTEIGYTYRRHSTLNPWESRGFAFIENQQNEDVIIWEKQPVDLDERSIAIKSLYNVCRDKNNDLLKGILYWKFTTIKKHYEIEPFVVYLGPDMPDPLVKDLALFQDKC